MEVSVNKNLFQEAVGKTLGVVERKTTMPILNNILLLTNDNNLQIIATDREITLISTLEAEILEKGSIAVSARNLYGIFRETREEQVNLKSDAQYRLRVDAGKTIFRLNGLSPEDFPSVISEGDVPTYPFSTETLKKMIRKTLYAVATEEFRPGLRGVYVETESDNNDEIRFKMTATDGHRLAMVYAPPDEGRGLVIEKGVIVPRKGVLEMRKILDSAGDMVYIGVSRSNFVVHAGNSVLRCGLLEEDFPDYRRVIPKDEGYVAFVNRQDFQGALRKVKVITDNRFTAVTLNLKKGKLLLHTSNPDVGDVTDDVEAEYDGGDFQISFNVDYLLQAVEVMDGDDLVLDFRGGMRPTVLKSRDRDDYITVIMPLRM